MLTAALAAGALAASTIPIHDAVAGSSPPSDVFEYTTAKNVRRIAGGVGARVVFRVTCAPGNIILEQSLEIRQAYPDGRIARGFGFIFPVATDCNGEEQRVPATVFADNLAFLEGPALVTSRMFVCNDNFFECQNYTDATEVEISDPPPPRSVIHPIGALVVEGDEGSTTADVVVRLNRPSAEPVTIDWETVAGPPDSGVAEPGVDFESGSGTLTFAPGETEQTIPLEVFGDTEVEAPLLYGEWGLIAFSNPSANAVLDTTSFFGFGAVIILDDDVDDVIIVG